MCFKFDTIKNILYVFLTFIIINCFVMLVLGSIVEGMVDKSKDDDDVINKIKPLAITLASYAFAGIFFATFGWVAVKNHVTIMLYVYVICVLVGIVSQAIIGVRVFLGTKNDDSYIIVNNDNIKTIAIAYISTISIQVATMSITVFFMVIFIYMMYKERNTGITETTYLMTSDT